jgi:hypothetical protein
VALARTRRSNGSAVTFRIYEWVSGGHVFRIVARTDGVGDPRVSIEADLTNRQSSTAG